MLINSFHLLNLIRASSKVHVQAYQDYPNSSSERGGLLDAVWDDRDWYNQYLFRLDHDPYSAESGWYCSRSAAGQASLILWHPVFFEKTIDIF